jgi:hypothetical protein
MGTTGFSYLMPKPKPKSLNGKKDSETLIRSANLIINSNKNSQIINTIMRLKRNGLLRFNRPGINSLRNVANQLQRNFNNAVNIMTNNAANKFTPSKLKLSPNMKEKVKNGAIKVKQNVVQNVV